MARRPPRCALASAMATSSSSRRTRARARCVSRAMARIWACLSDPTTAVPSSALPNRSSPWRLERPCAPRVAAAAPPSSPRSCSRGLARLARWCCTRCWTRSARSRAWWVALRPRWWRDLHPRRRSRPLTRGCSRRCCEEVCCWAASARWRRRMRRKMRMPRARRRPRAAKEAMVVRRALHGMPSWTLSRPPLGTMRTCRS
mmetsp:Transcript_3157/g.9764  ORF Transcript_3157/g.9764 Transcript_3157/m.9764 type:complete len:201 (+) Transcript_3157:1442-2044(+)